MPINNYHIRVNHCIGNHDIKIPLKNDISDWKSHQASQDPTLGQTQVAVGPDPTSPGFVDYICWFADCWYVDILTCWYDYIDLDHSWPGFVKTSWSLIINTFLKNLDLSNLPNFHDIKHDHHLIKHLWSVRHSRSQHVKACRTCRSSGHSSLV